LKVADLNRQTEAQNKQALILKGEGESAYKRQIINADGALTQKLETFQATVVGSFEALSKQRMVPDIVMGGNGSANGVSNVTALIDMLMAKTAKDLQLDLTIQK
jgi:hypothetical protein